MGCIYRRGKVYWVKYYRNGRAYQESSGSDKKGAAKWLLRQREGEISKGGIPGICFDRVRFEELAEDLLTDYRVNARKSLERAKISIGHLSRNFAGMRITEITTNRIKKYVQERIEEGLSPGSVNRELSALKRMLHLGARCTPPKVGQVPYVPMMKESNIRKGFFTHEEFLALRGALPKDLRPLVAFAYNSGWRKGEILGLTWDRVDLKEGVIRLDPGETKNGEGRTLYLNEDLWGEMRTLHGQRRLGCPYVFHRGGQQIRDFRESWKKACKEVGLWAWDEKKGRAAPSKLFHDFRRTAVRNMIRGGIAERVAMTISGHKTRLVFDRYNIVSPEDLKEAARKQQAYLDSQNGYNLVTVSKKMASLDLRGKEAFSATH